MSIFERASRLKLHFATSRGPLLTEDLWDLPLTSKTNKVNLDEIARNLFKQLKNGDDVSFVEPERKSDETLQLSFDIVKHIIDVRLQENKAAAEAKQVAERKQKILSFIEEKQDEGLKAMSIEELRKLVAA